MTKFHTQRKTFTLIEMLVVVVIIGILAVTLVPRLVGARERASDSARIVKVGQISSAVELYAQEKGTTYPLAPLTTTGTSIARQDITDAISPYLTNIPTDPGKGTVAIQGEPGNIQVTGDSFAYWTNTGGTVYAITALMESKKGNTTNATQIIDSDKQGGYQKVGKGLTTIIAPTGGEGGGGGPSNPPTVYGPDIVISYGGTTYTIKDRNVGATEAGIGPTSYGYYFQWGNNFGFPTYGDLIPNSTDLVDTSAYNSTNQFSSDTRIYNPSRSVEDRSITTNNNLRPAGGQGPCPIGYHIPSNTERGGLYTTRKNIHSPVANTGTLLESTLLLPRAGRRWLDSFGPAYDQANEGFYWTTTPKTAYAHAFYFTDSNINYDFGYYRQMGYSIRCFKN